MSCNFVNLALSWAQEELWYCRLSVVFFSLALREGVISCGFLSSKRNTTPCHVILVFECGLGVSFLSKLEVLI